MSFLESSEFLKDDRPNLNENGNNPFCNPSKSAIKKGKSKW